MRIYWLDQFDTGNLGMMARPKGNDWLHDELTHLKFQGVDVVVSLLKRHEEYELEIDLEQGICEELGLAFVSFPIEDRSVPEDSKEFNELITSLYQALSEGKTIVVHCRMGIGRASLVVASLLIKNGMDADLVFEYISERRTLHVPDTEEQIKWIEEIVPLLVR